jgi:predicted anti-sigma-YlaC factor YlaD
VTGENCVLEEIGTRLNSGNVCYHCVQNLLASHLLSENIKIKIYRTVIVLGCETWSPVLIEGHRRRAFQNNVMRNMWA